MQYKGDTITLVKWLVPYTWLQIESSDGTRRPCKIDDITGDNLANELQKLPKITDKEIEKLKNNGVIKD